MTDWIALMEDHWAWLVFAALLGIGEVLIPGVFLIWIAILVGMLVDRWPAIHWLTLSDTDDNIRFV